MDEAITNEQWLRKMADADDKCPSVTAGVPPSLDLLARLQVLLDAGWEFHFEKPPTGTYWVTGFEPSETDESTSYTGMDKESVTAALAALLDGEVKDG